MHRLFTAAGLLALALIATPAHADGPPPLAETPPPIAPCSAAMDHHWRIIRIYAALQNSTSYVLLVAQAYKDLCHLGLPHSSLEPLLDLERVAWNDVITHLNQPTQADHAAQVMGAIAQLMATSPYYQRHNPQYSGPTR